MNTAINMRRILAIILIAVGCVHAFPQPHNVFEIDLSSEEAQRFIDHPPLDAPRLAAKTAELPLVRWNDPRFRSAESGPTNGHYWKNGHEIDNTEDYVEEVYEASQFHGQDGLGKFAFGYAAPESSRLENREHDGVVRGSYTYQDPAYGQVKVQYYSDHDGFHAQNNIPTELPQPAQETAEVREARVAHERAWQEAAAAARANPDPSGEYDATKYEYESSASQKTLQQVRAPAPVAAPTAVKQAKVLPKHLEDEEPKGPPRGFFYSFDYPVSIIVPKNARTQQRPADGTVAVADDDTLGLSVSSYRG